MLVGPCPSLHYTAGMSPSSAHLYFLPPACTGEKRERQGQERSVLPPYTSPTEEKDNLEFIFAVEAGRSSPGWVKKVRRAARDMPERLLQWAAYRGDLDGVQQGMGLCNPNANGSLALRWACQQGHVGVVRHLLLVSDLSQAGVFAAAAAKKGQLAALKAVIEDCEGRTQWEIKGVGCPLSDAVRTGQVEILRVLLDHPTLGNSFRCAEALKDLFRKSDSFSDTARRTALLMLVAHLPPERFGQVWDELFQPALPVGRHSFLDLLVPWTDLSRLRQLVRQYKEKGLEHLDAKVKWSLIPQALARVAAADLEDHLREAVPSVAVDPGSARRPRM